METIQIKLSTDVMNEAVAYAGRRGTDISSLVEDYLIRLIRQKKTEKVIPDIIQSLLGAGEPAEEDDLNGRKAYQAYLEEKYK